MAEVSDVYPITTIRYPSGYEERFIQPDHLIMYTRPIDLEKMQEILKSDKIHIADVAKFVK